MGAHLSMEQVAEILDLPPSIVDKLVRSGQLPGTAEGVPVAEVQAYLSASFVRLFQAQARASPAAKTVAATPPPPPAHGPTPPSPPPANPPATATAAPRDEPGASPGISSPASGPELRRAPRYVMRRQLGGTFHHTRITLLQISTSGLRIRHEEPLRAGEVSRLQLALLDPARSYAMQAAVVWTTVGSSACVSGLRVLDAAPLQDVIQHLTGSKDLLLDKSVPRRRSSSFNAAALEGLNDDEVAAVIRAVRLFSSDPVEAGRWYARARFALTDERVRAAAPTRGRDREEVIGLWEYLERRMDIRTVAKVVAWLRLTRASAAETPPG